MEQLTQQQKLEILCVYLPYGVEVEITINESGVNINPRQRLTIGNIASLLQINPRPILRHPDDMTAYELSELLSIVWKASNISYKDDNKLIIDTGNHIPLNVTDCVNILRYLHSRHIDTFGAIESGLAIRKNK